MRTVTPSITRVALVVVMLITGCKDKDEAPKTTPTDPSIVKPNLSGYAQKGPYLKGGTVTIAELKTDLTPTGKSFTTTITSNSGYFAFTDPVSQFALAELTVEGLYFNEVEARVSEAPLKLSVITDRAKTGTVNINLMTQIEKDRVKNLVSKGTTFANAKLQAAKEVLAVFSISNFQVSETMDISQRTDVHGGLLAMSAIIQSNLSVTDMTAVATAISNDLKEDGVLNDNALRTTLRDRALALSASDIRRTLYTRYSELELKTWGVPNFESPVFEFSGQGAARGSVLDVNGRLYRTLRIGAQWWMVDNLKTARYADATAMLNGNEVNGDDATVYYFTRDKSNGNPGNTDDLQNFGYFYTRAATMRGKPASTSSPSGVQGVCPNGWHVPSNAEFNILLDHIQTRGYTRSPDVTNNELGFNLLKPGYRGYDISNWGVSSIDWGFITTDGKVTSGMPTNAAYNIRCVKD